LERVVGMMGFTSRNPSSARACAMAMALALCLAATAIASAQSIGSAYTDYDTKAMPP
jgi:hypothetical protein